MIAEFLFLLTLSCIILSQIVPWGLIRRWGACLTENSSRVEAYSREGGLVDGHGAYSGDRGLSRGTGGLVESLRYHLIVYCTVLHDVI